MRIAAPLIASLLLTAGCAAPGVTTPAQSDGLTWAPPLADGFEALPRVSGDTPPAREINAFLDRMDVRAREERGECLSDASTLSDNREWGRSVEAPMTGPRFLSLLVTTGYYCGGAHPDWAQKALTFDLMSGRQVDWATQLPADMALPRHEASDHWPQLLKSPSLIAWYGRQAVAQRQAAVAGEDECAEVLTNGSDVGALNIWLDARSEGLAAQVTGLAHVVAACTETVIMPLDELQRRGANPAMIEALEAAHRQNRWRPASPETTPQ